MLDTKLLIRCLLGMFELFHATKLLIQTFVLYYVSRSGSTLNYLLSSSSQNRRTAMLMTYAVLTLYG